MPKEKRSKAKKFAEIENISMGGMITRLSPVGLWVYSKYYLIAANSVPEPNAPYEPVRYFLVCHSIELSLKAFLSINGSAMLELAESKFGHNIDSIFDEAEKQGLLDIASINVEHTNEIRAASHYYSGKVFEYPAMGEAVLAYPDLPKLSLLLEAADILVTSLESPCKEAS